MSENLPGKWTGTGHDGARSGTMMSPGPHPVRPAAQRSMGPIEQAKVYRTPAAPAPAPVRAERDITIFVACYNEERDIIDTLVEISSAMNELAWTWEIIVIDDASTDGSVAKVRRYMDDHADQPLILVVLKENRGLAQNFVEAAFLGSGTYYKLVSGDNPESREQLVSVLRHCGEADMIILDVCVPNRSLYRRVLSRTFTLLVNLISGHRIRYYNGACVHHRSNVLRWHTNNRGFDFQAELIMNLLDQGMDYVEVPSVHRDRSSGYSKALTLKNLVSSFRFFIDLVIRRVERTFGSGKTRSDR